MRLCDKASMCRPHLIAPNSRRLFPSPGAVRGMVLACHPEGMGLTAECKARPRECQAKHLDLGARHMSSEAWVNKPFDLGLG